MKHKLTLIVLILTLLLLLMSLVPTHVLAADTVTLYANKDNYIFEYTPNWNGDGHSITIGGSSAEGNRRRGVVGFTVSWGSDIPDGATITSATFKMLLVGFGDTGWEGQTLLVQRLLRLDWDEMTSNWNVYKTGLSWAAPGAGSSATDYTTANQASATLPTSPAGIWIEWDVTAQVQWAQANDKDVAFRIVAASESWGGSVGFRPREDPNASYHPKLVLTYVPLGPPGVTTQTATNVAGDSALLNGTITSTGGTDITRRGFKYGIAKTDTWDTYETGNFGTGTYSRAVSGLLTGTTYWFRAYAVNNLGTNYGLWMSFKTIELPAVTTNDATYVGSTGARLNGRLGYDGGEACEYRFQYGYASGVYAFATPWEGSKTTGSTFYMDVSNLISDTTYYFRAQTRNSAGVSNANERSFTTSWELLPPTQFSSHATSGTDISLLWVRGGGSYNTLIRMKKDSHPTTTDEGTQVYFGQGSSISVTALTPGTTYYFSAWGESSGDYSAEYATTMTTTLAGTPVTTPTEPSEPGGWFQIPSTARITNMPFYDWVNRGFDKYDLPHVTGWVWLALLLSALAGVGTLALYPRESAGGVSSGAIYAALIVSGFVMLIARWQGILPWWLILIPVTIGGSYAFVRSRA